MVSLLKYTTGFKKKSPSAALERRLEVPGSEYNRFPEALPYLAERRHVAVAFVPSRTVKVEYENGKRSCT